MHDFLPFSPFHRQYCKICCQRWSICQGWEKPGAPIVFHTLSGMDKGPRARPIPAACRKGHTLRKEGAVKYLEDGKKWRCRVCYNANMRKQYMKRAATRRKLQLLGGGSRQ